MSFRLGETSQLVLTWADETFRRVTVTILPLFIIFCALGHSTGHSPGQFRGQLIITHFTQRKFTHLPSVNIDLSYLTIE